jgi:zinc protease
VRRAALVVVVALLALPARADKPDLQKRPSLAAQPAWNAPAPASATTAAGTRVVVLPQHELPLVHLLVCIPAGSALDPPDRPGLAAATAGMLQDGGAGARSAPAVAQAFADVGTELEEHVDADQVQLQLTVLARDLERTLALVGDLLARPRFDAADWQRAQARRVDEIHRRLDEPEHLADDLFGRVLYGTHPYAHPFLGTQASVRAISAAELRAFWAAHYGPRTVSFVLVGDVDGAAATPLIARALDGWRSTAQPPPPPPPPVPPPATRVVLVDRPGATQSEIRVGHLGKERKTPDFAALSLLETVLGGSFTSRLNLNLREKHGYTYGARATFELRTVAGPFVAAAGVRTDATAAALKETVAEIAGMRAPLAADELQKGRLLVMHAVVEAFADGNETTAYFADLIAHGLALEAWSKLPAELAALDVATVTRAAARLFQTEHLVIVVVGDRKAIEPELRLLPFVPSVDIVTP